MGYVGVSLCDMCGRRTENFAGKLNLMGDFKMKDGWVSHRTVRSWKLCKRCLNKVTGMKTFGDEVKEELEVMLDQIRVNHNRPKLLEGLGSEKSKPKLIKGKK